jgi:UDPglucose 6-dehydrogenase
MNEIANLCEKVGADVDSVRIGMGSDNRIGKRFLFPGVGYGGSCFPKDVQALAKTASQNDYDFKILKSVMEVNRIQKSVMVHKIKKFFGDDLDGKTIGMWGLAFKPNTDDIREAPALYIIEELLEAGAKIKTFDPEAMENVKEIFGDRITYCENQYEAIEDVDVLAIVTEWSVFRTPDFDKVAKLIRSKAIFDGRNLYDLDKMGELGFYYESIGRTPVTIKAFSA